MDLDLSDDQVALRDGIASLLDGRVPHRPRPRAASTARCSTSSPRRACSRCAPTASPGPTASSCSSSSAGTAFPARSWRRCCSATAGSPASSSDAAPMWVEHLDALDDVVVLSGPATARRVDPSASTASRRRGRSTRCTPVTRVERLPARRRRSTPTPTSGRRAGAALTAALQLGLADRLHRARGRVREGAGAVRPADRLVPGDQAPAAPTCSCAPRSRAPRSTRGRARSTTTPRSPDLDRAGPRRQGGGRRGRDRERQGRDAGVRRHGLHVGGRRAPLPEARVGARHVTSAPPTAMPTSSAERSPSNLTLPDG